MKLRGLPSKIVKRYFSQYFENIANENKNLYADISSGFRLQGEKIEKLSAIVESCELRLSKQAKMLRAIYHDSNRDREELRKIRATKEYTDVLRRLGDSPLVSIRIATYNRPKQLLELALPSVLAQTYKNIEVVIVGDHTDQETVRGISKLKDKRVKFYNLEQKTWYPEDAYDRWLVIGAAPANEAIRRCTGDWIVTLDDDDTFREDHVQTLIDTLKDTRAEMAYSALRSVHISDGTEKIIWSSPPEAGNFSLMGAIYMRCLADIFKVDEYGYVMDEPQDWYLCRRMVEAGIKYSSTKKITGDINMLTYKEKEM